MDRLNYHHLLYFHTVVREGGVARGARKRHLAQPTVSGQLRQLEEALGEKLFQREGRRLVLTEVGRLVQHYADGIFALGEELTDTLQRRPTGQPLRLTVGITDGVPKLVAYRLLEPALRLPEPVRLVVREEGHESLLAELALHHLDVVLSDAPSGSSVRVKVFDHLLGETPLSWFAAPRLAARLRPRFPRSLEGAPVLLPPPGTALRRALDTWFEAQSVHPRVVAELDDSALANVMAQEGLGIFPAPEVIAAEMKRQHGVVSLGRVKGVAQRFHAITVERRLQHPAVAALTSAARRELFA